MKACIFGGSFDPPHEGHRHLARAAFASLALDRLFWVPAQDPPHKAAPATPFAHRLALVRLAIADLPGLLTLAREVELPVIGLMCVPPAAIEPAPFFALLDKLARDHGLPGRSMGMSGDYETAIMLGATHVRVGSALFGARPG